MSVPIKNFYSSDDKFKELKQFKLIKDYIIINYKNDIKVYDHALYENNFKFYNFYENDSYDHNRDDTLFCMKFFFFFCICWPQSTLYYSIKFF